MSLLVLSADDVEEITSGFTSKYLEDLMKDVFTTASLKPSDGHNPLRSSISSDQHTTLFMPARLNQHGTTVKIVSVPKSSEDSRGLPASTLVFDEETGGVRAIINARSLTALRNAAGSLLSTRLVGPTAPTNLVVFGSGQQIKAHIELFCKSYPSIKRLCVVNHRMSDRFSTFVDNVFTEHSNLTVQSLCPEVNGFEESLREALGSASIIVCATPSTKALFSSNYVHAGTHVILIGSYKPHMREVDDDLVKRAVSGTLLVDSWEACSQEAGELLSAGISRSDVFEIGELAERRELALRGDDINGPITMFKSVGIGLQDVAIATAVVRAAEDREGLGVVVRDYDS